MIHRPGARRHLVPLTWSARGEEGKEERPPRPRDTGLLPNGPRPMVSIVEARGHLGRGRPDSCMLRGPADGSTEGEAAAEEEAAV